MDKINDHLLTHFLFDSTYRIWRHLLLVLIGAVITFNQAFLMYQDSRNLLGDRIYGIGIPLFLLYLLAMYFNYFYLTPQFLLRGKYIRYAVSLSLLVFLLPTLSIAGEYLIRNRLMLPHRITAYLNPLILVDNLSSSVITAICFCGISVIMLFRKWMKGEEQVMRLEEEQLRSELIQLKGAVAPAFLSRTLRSTAALAENNPGGTTHLLIRLGELLRYQLYDSKREAVLFSSEIDYLVRFLELEKANRPALEYQIRMGGDCSKLFIAPMLFISIVQCIIDGTDRLNLSFDYQNRTLSFLCEPDNPAAWDENLLSPVRKRLELQYRDRYRLELSPGKIVLQIDFPG